MAMHTQNLQGDARASLLVTHEDTDGEPLGASRVTLVGNVHPVPDTELAEVRKLYLDRHASSKYWVDFGDFSFCRMDVVDVYYVGGFGVMGWESASDYDRSQQDPLADSMSEIIQHMNTDHNDALVLLARTFARIESTEAIMTAVDRLGFHVRFNNPGRHARAPTSPSRRRYAMRRELERSWWKWCNKRGRSQMSSKSGTQLAHWTEVNPSPETNQNRHTCSSSLVERFRPSLAYSAS
jgi:hypothetical protein